MPRFIILLSLLIALPASAASTLQVPGGILEIHGLETFTGVQRGKLQQWLVASAETTSLLNGAFPRSRTTIQLQHAQRGEGPVPWAQTLRAIEPQGVAFHINPQQPLSAFVGDWTAIHEFSHLFLPYPGKRDIWLSEGFASYYQNILMARAGTLTEVQMWEKLLAGFKRGEKNQHNLRLDELSEHMRSHRAFMRVYWSGALYYLHMDIHLRQQGSSLDEVVTEFVACCRDRERWWRGPALAAEFDRLASSKVFSERYESYRSSARFPEYRELFRRLGISHQGKRVTLSAEGDLAHIRPTLVARPFRALPDRAPNAGD